MISVRWMALATGAAFFAVAVACLYQTHPAEDAYILFKYVDNFVAGHGIVYNIGGPRTEGATDFLWFLALCAFSRLGLDVVVAAALGNALGAGLIAFVLLTQVRRSSLGDRSMGNWLGLFLCIAILLVGGAIAGYTGFGSVFYTGVVLLLVSRFLDGGRANLISVPLLGLVVALIRPDGLILSAGYGLIGLVLAWRHGWIRGYLASTAVAVVGGAAYFLWRFHYFGLLLPLPLYVKSSGHSAGIGLPGLAEYARWIRSTAGPACMLVVLIVLTSVALRRRDRRRALFLLLLLAPALLHLAAFAFAHQTQNVAYRFQAPAFMIGLLCTIALAALVAEQAESLTRRLTGGAIVACLILAIPSGTRNLVHFITAHEYLDTFGFEAGRALSRRNTVALTEAGRLAYWTEARVIDVVGLNDPHSATTPLSVDYIESLDPDLLLFSTGGGFYPDPLVPAGAGPVLRVSASDLERTVLPAYQGLLTGSDPSSFHFTPVALAPVILIKFLAQSPAYDVFLVRSGNTQAVYAHVVAFRHAMPKSDELLAALIRSNDPRAFKSYATLKGFPLAHAN